MGSKQGNPADEILPGLWLGNRQASQDLNWLHKQNIKAVFNCTKDIPFARLPLHFQRVPVDDNLQQDEIRNLEHWSHEVVQKIAAERQAGHNILVHCAAGMQRSAACVAMYLIATHRCTTDEAIAQMKTKRPVAFFTGANFYPAIRGFELGFRKQILDSGSAAKFPKIPLQ